MIKRVKSLYDNVFLDRPSNEELREDAKSYPELHKSVDEYNAFMRDRLKPEGFPDNCIDLCNWQLYDTLMLTPYQRMRNSEKSLFREHFDYKNGRHITNMQQYSMLPVPQQMLVERIFFLFNPENNPADNNRFKQIATWTFYLGTKNFVSARMLESNTTGRYTDVQHLNGYPNALVPIDALLLDKPYALHIHAQQTFWLQFDLGDDYFQPSSFFKVSAFLDGVLARPVQ